MITAISFTAIALSTLLNTADAEFISRVEAAELLDSSGKPIPRVKRDADGNVESLQLNEMQLSADDYAAIGRLKSLRSLSLFRTNATNAAVRQLVDLPHLEALNLTSTEVTDAAIDEIMKLKSLRSLCLGNVAITPEAVARLKAQFRIQKRQLSLGYSRRK